MSLAVPKLDTRTLEGLQRLKNNHDFQLLVKHQTALYEYCKEALVACDPAEAPRIQGRASQLRDFLNDLKKGTP